MKYIGSCIAGGVIGGALALGVIYLIWSVPGELAASAAGQVFASIIGISGVLAGFGVGAWLGIHWEFGKKGHCHDFVPIRVRQRAYVSGAHGTDIESMCECGKTRVRTIPGWWELSEVRDPQGTVRSAEWGLTP